MIAAALGLPLLLSCGSVPAPTQTQSASQAASRPTSRPATAPASQPAGDGVKVVKPFEDITVIIDRAHPDQSRVEVSGFACLDAGWLEQVVCSPSTREHESLVVARAKPSHIHAALLMAGFEPGKPGRWTYENQKFGAVDPTGDKVAVRVRYTDKSGKVVEEDIGKWIHEPASAKKSAKPFPHEPWVFGGSAIERNNANAPGEHYVADMTGSIIGLVTFGDEMIGFSRVLSDQESVQEPEWEVNSEAVPPMGTAVTVIISKWKD